MARRALEIVITGDSRGASRAFRGVEQQAGTLTGRLKGVGGAAARAFGAFGAAYTAQAAIRAVATQTIEFDKSMRNVNSIAQLNEKQFGKLSKEVLKLAGPTAQAPQTLAEGLYDLVSSGFDSAESLTILESSARAATAGLTTTEVSTKAVAAVLNSYQLPAKSAAKVSDQLFRTVDRGVISFEDLASGVGDVLPFAASLNVGLDQVGASTATMTKAGISSSETMTRLKAIFSTMLKPGEDLANQIKSLGFESGETMVNQLGLQKTLEKLSGSVGGNKSAIAQLFPNVRALGGVLALTGKNAAGANADLLGMKDASGATAKALSQQSKSISYQWQKLKAQASVMAIEFGQKLVPAAKEVLAALSDDSLSGTEKLQKIGNVLTKQVTVAAGKIPDIVAKVAPAVLKSGAVLGVALLKGMVKGFAESDILGKLLIGGALIRLIGGKGALLKTGATMGSMLGGSMGLTAGTSFMARFAPTIASAKTGMATVMTTSALAGGGLSGAGAAAGGLFAKFFATGIGRAIPGIAAAIGLVDIVSSALSGDMKGAGIKSGGALIGGLLGSFGGPAGIAIGAGIGTFVAPLGAKLIGGLFGGAEDELAAKRAEAAAIGAKAAEAVAAGAAASKSLADSSRTVVRAQKRRTNAVQEVNRAEANLAAMSRQYAANSAPVLNAAVRLARARRGVATATKAVQNAERLEGVQRQATAAIMKAGIADQKREVWSLRDKQAAIQRTLAVELKGYRRGTVSIDQLTKTQQRLTRVKRQADDAEGKLNRTYLQAATQIGPKFAASLKRMSASQSEFSRGTRNVVRAVNQSRENLGLNQWRNDFLNIGKWAKDGYQNAGEASKRLGDNMRDLDSKSRKHARNVRSAITSIPGPVRSAYSGMATDANNAAAAFGAQSRITLGFRGGGRVPLSGAQMAPAMVSPGEVVEHKGRKWTVPGRPEPKDSVFASLPVGARVFTYDGQYRLAQGESKQSVLKTQAPHFSTGGQVRSPKLSGGNRIGRESGQAAIDMIRKAAVRWVREHSASNTGEIGTYRGVRMADWVIGALKFAANKGAGPQPTSGYRSHAENVAAGRNYFSEHEKTLYPGGAVDFGGYTTGLSAKMSVVNATRGYKYPLLAPIGFRDDGHASGTGHRRGGIIGRFGGGGVVKKAANILTRRGFDHKAIAGILGNAYGESMWNPASMEPNTDNGGLFGFTAGEKSLANLRAFADREGKPWTDVGTQIRFMLKTGGAGLKGRLNALDSIRDTTKLFMDEYERPNAQYAHLDKRIDGGFKASKYLRGIGFGSGGGGGGGSTPEPRLTAKQRKAQAASRKAAAAALRYAKAVRAEAKNGKLAKRGVEAAKRAAAFIKAGDFEKANKWTKRAQALAGKAAQSIPGLTASRPGMGTRNFDPSDPFSPTNLPGFAGLPPSVKRLIMAPGLSWQGKRDLATMAVDAAGATATKRDDAAAYNLTLGLERGRRRRAQKTLRKANAVLARGGLTKKQRNRWLKVRDASLAAVTESSGEIRSTNQSIRELNQTENDGGTDLATAMKELADAIKSQTAMQSSVQATGSREALRMLSDVISGEIVGKRAGVPAQIGVRY